MKIAIKTLGCKVNQAESCFIAASFQNAGFELVDFGEDADLFVVNGCAVTQEAEKKTRQMIHRLLNRNPVPLIFLIGCYAKRLISLGQDPFLHQVHFIDSPDKVTALIDVLCQEWGFQLYPVELPALHQSRIWLKVEDGCDHFCSYCIIPHLRGPVLSTASSLVIHQAQQLEERGIREIVLCGINLGLYGREKGSYFLIDLLEDLVRETSSVRFRLSSIEPFLLDLNFLDRFFSLLPRVCSHFHIPLQSGSGVILRTMNRGYTPDFYRTLIRQIRQRSPKIAVSTDIITGFPGEGEDHFQETVRLSQEIVFSRTHLFIFSSRSGTRAFTMEREGGIPFREKKRREKILLDIARTSRQDYQHQFIGQTLNVLIESTASARKSSGYSENYIPVLVNNTRDYHLDTVVPVRIESEAGDVLVGTVADIQS